jgi:hypothetical protein
LHLREVRQHDFIHARLHRIQQRLEALIVEFIGQRPTNACLHGSTQALLDR